MARSVARNLRPADVAFADAAAGHFEHPVERPLGADPQAFINDQIEPAPEDQRVAPDSGAVERLHDDGVAERLGRLAFEQIELGRKFDVLDRAGIERIFMPCLLHTVKAALEAGDKLTIMAEDLKSAKAIEEMIE